MSSEIADRTSHLPGAPNAFLLGGGAMGVRMRAHDWSQSQLGPAESWPQSLRSAVSICLTSGFQIAIYWGPHLSLIYNDAWSPILGRKHPESLGRPAVEVWPEIWDTIGPLFRQVFETGDAIRFQDSLLAMHRHGFTEECYFDYTFSPIRDETGKVGGIFNAVVETSFRVVGERRTRFLRDLGEKLANVESVTEVLRVSQEALAGDSSDLPFALIYLLEPQSGSYQRRLIAGMHPEHSAAPMSVSAGELWSPSSTPHTVDQLRSRIPESIPARPWPEPCDVAIVSPLDEGAGGGFLVAGASPRLALDSEYRAFFDRVTVIVGRSLARARSMEAAKERSDALAALDRAKTEFFSNVSHEFRTPITLILGPIEESLENPESFAIRPALQAAQRNAIRLLRLVNSLLDFTRLEAGRAKPNFRPVDLAQFTRELASNFASACDKAGLRLEVECDPLDEPAFVDPAMWEKIVLNLISNAFKFTFEGGIRVALERRGHQAVLVVSDTGTGIPANQLNALFERFHRVEGARGRSHEGSGIGLALVKELTALHGGDVSVQSELGKGSSFTVTIPLGSSHLPQGFVEHDQGPVAAERVAASSYVEEALQWLTPEPDNKPARAPADERQNLLRVLFADDNTDMRNYVGRLLVGEYDVRMARDGLEALEIATTWNPDVVLSDVMMPRLDGFGLVRELRRREETALVPIVLLSARAGDEARVEGIERGATDYLVKPFSARELLARVAAHAHGKRAREEAATVLSRVADGFVSLDRDWRYTSANDRACEFIGLARREIVGHRLWDLFPESGTSPLRHALQVALETGIPRTFEHFEPKQRRWYENRIYPSPTGVSIFFVDITKQKEAEDSLKETDRRKTEFLAILAHELRNPLAPVRTASHLLKRADLSPDMNKAREIIDRQVGTMARLIDDLMDVSRISSGKMTLRRSPVDLREVVGNAIETSRPRFEAEGQRLKAEIPDNPICALGDTVRLSQVVSNLLNNASRYSDPGKSVTLSLRSEEGSAVITVKDQGIGIHSVMLPKIWDMFVQSSAGKGTIKGGLGIGLTLVRSLVQMHGGTVEARSDGPGLGSTFAVRIPLIESGRGASSVERPEILPTDQKRIVIADDNVDGAESLALFLRSQGHEVHVARDGVEALNTISAVQPDIAILDIGMPRLTGYEVSMLVRKDPRHVGMVLIALTGWGAEEDRKRAREAGFDHHLVKPADPISVQTLVALQPPA